MNGFMYGNTYDDMERYERQSVFPKLLCGNAEDFSLANTNFNRDAVKAGTGRRTLGGCLDENSHCYTLEVSFFSYQSTTGQAMPYTEEGYMKLGRNLARTFVDYYKLAGVVSAKPSSSIVPKPGAYRIRDRNVQERSNTDSQFEEKPPQSSQDDRSTVSSRRQYLYSRPSDLSINSTNTFSDVSTNIRLQLRERERDRKQY
ncbi:hypothetical protein DPMN_082962 [Dreissena polymorpha]|uniref:Uncharacterized protein n=2 Tax=Dreissena polymorpha TaxID=45954 RepID=A0A9D3Y918_DREPO|nr:hypothetical protein DPMN_082962 [Dreissena polymorpha]